MAKEVLATLTHDECRHIGRVLEGVAGALHEGRAVERDDLREAAQIAEWAWQAAPKPDPARARDFEAAHAAFVRSSDGAARGQPREGGLAERAALRMAIGLRHAAGDCVRYASRKELPKAVDEGIRRLARRYASHGQRAAAA